MTEEQWEALRDAAENTLSNLRSFRPGPDRQDDLIELLTAALEAIPG